MVRAWMRWGLLGLASCAMQPAYAVVYEPQGKVVKLDPAATNTVALAAAAPAATVYVAIGTATCFDCPVTWGNPQVGLPWSQSLTAHGDVNSTSMLSYSVAVGSSGGATIVMEAGTVAVDMTLQPGATGLSATEVVYMSDSTMTKAGAQDGDWCSSSKHIILYNADGSARTWYAALLAGSRPLTLSVTKLKNKIGAATQ